MALTQTQVSQLYVTLFGRVSEGAGNKYWQSAVSDVAAGADAMLATSAAQEYFGSALTSNEAFIKHIYKNTLNKSEVEDPAGIKFWVDALKAGNSRGLVVSELIKAAQDPANKGAAQDYFNNKVALSDYTATKVEGKDLKVKDLAPFKEALTKVTSNPSSLTDAKAFVDTLVNISTDSSVDWNSAPANPGKPAELTTDTDTLTANVFNAGMKHNPGGTDRIMTLQSSDKLTGDASRADNTLNAEFGHINDDEADPGSRTPILNNIQNINIQVTGTVNTLDLRDSNDVEKVNIDRVTKEAANKFTVESIGQKLDGMRLANVAKDKIEVTFEHKNGVLLGSEDKTSVFLEDVKAKSLTVKSENNTEGYELVNLVSKQGVKLDKLALDKAKEVVVKGSGSLHLADVKLDTTTTAPAQFDKYTAGGGLVTNDLTKLDASKYAGKLTLDISNLVADKNDPLDSGKELDTTITGTNSGDVFYLNNNPGERTTIDFGKGDDKLVLVGGGITDHNNKAEGTIKNLETLELRDQAGATMSVDFDRFDENLANVTVRNETATDDFSTFELKNIKTKFAKEGKIVIEHAASGANTGPRTTNETTVEAKLKEDTDNDTLNFEVVNAKNYDNTFEYTIKAAKVENLNIADNDTESNTLYLDSNTIKDHTGTITLTGGTKGLYYAVDGKVEAKVIDASKQNSNLRLTVQDQKDTDGKNKGQDIKLGAGDDVLTFAELDGFDKKDVLTDNGGNDTIRALFSKDSALNVTGIEGIHVAAKKNVELDISKSDIKKVVVMSKQAVAQDDDVESLGEGVKGMKSNADNVDPTKIITFKTSNIDTLHFAGDINKKAYKDAANVKADKDNLQGADDATERVKQDFNGVKLENNTAKEVNVNINSSLDYVSRGAQAYNVDQITIHGSEKINVNVGDERFDIVKADKTVDKGTTVTTIKNIYAKNLTTLVANAQKDLKLGTVTANAANNSITLVDATNVLGKFEADVVGLGDGAQVKMNGGDNTFSALGSAGKLINISSGDGKDTITGSAQSDFINAGNGNNTVDGDRGDNVITVGDGHDTIKTKDGNDTVVFGKGFDSLQDNIGTGLAATGATTTITKEFGAANVQISKNGTTVDVDQNIAVGNGSELKMQWEGGMYKAAGTLLDGVKAVESKDGAALSDSGKSDFWLVSNNGVANTTDVKGGEGNDVVIATADNVSITFNGGAGNDAAVGGAGSDVFKGGLGADVYVMQNKSWYDHNSNGTKDAGEDFDAKQDTVKIADGESTAAAWDKVYKFDTVAAGAAATFDTGNKAGTGGKDSLDLDYKFTTLAASDTITDKAVAEGKYGKTIAKFSLDADGKATFKDANNDPVKINEKNLEEALKLLAGELNGKMAKGTAMFEYDQNGDDNFDAGVDSTFVFQDGIQDTVVELVGTVGLTTLNGLVL